jgi:hypothetical protein
MRKVSVWGKNNPWKARIILAITHVILSMMAILLGLQAFFNDIQFTNSMMVVVLNVYLSAYLFYPIQGYREGLFRFTYIRQKKHDAVIVLTTFFILVGWVTQFAFEPLSKEEPQVMVIPIVLKLNEPIQANSTMSNRKDIRENLKTLRNSINVQEKEWKMEKRIGLISPDTTHTRNPLTIAAKAFLILFTLLLAGGLIGGVFSLSCSLFCSGHEIAAWIVAIGGFTLTIFLTIIAIRGIVRSGKSRKKKIAQSPSN